jgi:hypothetical protein
MKVFVKAKWPAIEVDGKEVNPTKKQRFELLPAAFEFVAQALADGAASVVIRPDAQ